jgi:signal transduction histidine kinase
MSRLRATFTARLTLTLAVLLLAYAALITALGRQVAAEQEQESLQRLSQGLAQHIVGHWPEIAAANPGQAEQAARDALLNMLMVVNPGIQVYLLDDQGRVQAYIGDPAMVQQPVVDLAPVRRFLAGEALPLHGTDPMGGGTPRIFSAAMFPTPPGSARPPGYLYVVLDGNAREQVAGRVGLRRVWLGAALAAGVGLLLTLVLGAVLLRRLTQPLHRLARRMRDYSLRQSPGAGPAPPAAAAGRLGDEVQAIAEAYEGMTQRIEQQDAQARQQDSAHREMMASVAHDLRTPLTALHGHLEALAGNTPAQPTDRRLAAALAQSDKVRRLSQQLFELATLQSTDQVLHRERFSLDELVSDAVQKFGLTQSPAPVVLCGDAPGRLELDGDLQLVERALTNLIDNALRHAPGAAPVRVSLLREGTQAQVLVEDAGPGLSDELLQRLGSGRSLRDPPLRRPGGGIGGLGLAIAQRVAQLHGGSLLPLATPLGGTRLCLALPLAA